MSVQEKLTATICDALQQLTPIKRAGVLFNTALALIEDGQYGEEVEKYFDVYLQTPGLPKEDMTRALLARSNVRRLSGERLLAKAQQDLHTVLQLDPSNKQVRTQLPRKAIHFSIEPAWQRAPPEIWEQIATHTPMYHLRTWLFLSHVHRDIASRYIFHTITINLGGCQDDLNRGLDILDHARSDPIFASRVKALRLNWKGSEDEVLTLLIHIFKTSLPAFKALRYFECAELPAMYVEMVRALLDTHKDLHGLGLISWTFRAVEIPFDNLRKFALSTEDDEGNADMKEIRAVLDRNEHTLKHLTLGGGPSEDGYWDLAFKSVTINNLTHLDLVDWISVSHFVLTRIAYSPNLQSLTLVVSFVDPASASVVFASDRIINGMHTLMPHLETFRLNALEEPDEVLYRSIVHFLQKREKIRRLDLDSCPWDMIRDILPDLTKLRVLYVRINHLSQDVIRTLVESIPTQMVAIKLSFGVSERFLNEYARYFIRFNTLSFLSFAFPTQTSNISQEDFLVQTNKSLGGIATTLLSLDFLARNGKVFVVARSKRALNKVADVNVVGEDAAWLERNYLPQL